MGQNQIQSSNLKNFSFLGLLSLFGIFNKKLALYTKATTATMRLYCLYAESRARTRVHSLSYTHQTLTLHKKRWYFHEHFKITKDAINAAFFQEIGDFSKTEL